MSFHPNHMLTLSTDFGTADGYVGAMKGRAYREDPSLVVVDITHEIPPWDIRRAAFALWTALPCFPPGTVHIVVVDPGVGTDRRALVALVGDHAVIAPDNGIISLLFEGSSPVSVFALDSSSLAGSTLSKTFHGRDLFVPVGARIAAGVMALPGSLAPLRDPLCFPCGHARRGADVHGTVLCADHFGNLITTIPWDTLPAPAAVTVRVAGFPVSIIAETYGDAPPGSMVALQGSSGLLEISCVQASAQAKLNATPGSPVVVSGA
jgi:S-adenosylmethionine hydrolase